MLRFSILAALLALAACGDTDKIYGGPPDMTALAAALEREIDAAVAVERADSGIEPAQLTRNKALDLAAQAYAEDMAERDFFAHENPEGENALVRLRRFAPGFSGIVGENIQSFTYARGAGFDPHATAAIVVAAWRESPGHKRTMMSTLFDRTGIGIAVDNGEVFVVQLFAKPLRAASLQTE